MRPKPAHLGPEYAAQFQDASVVAAYRQRLPYPDEVFDVLVDLLADRSGIVLDAGCGTGDLARRLAPLVDRVDAVDVSAAMLEAGRTLPGGDHSRLRWIAGALEDAPLDPPYGLVTAGESLHWMDWRVVLSRFHDALVPGGFLAIVNRPELPTPWRDELLAIITRYSTNREFQPYDLIEELETRDLFEVVGRHVTAPIPHHQLVGEYVESIHSRNGFSRDRMDAVAAAAFDNEVRALLNHFGQHESVSLNVAGDIVWGHPMNRDGK